MIRLKDGGNAFLGPKLGPQTPQLLQIHISEPVDIFIAKSLPSEYVFRFSGIVEIQEKSECVTEKNVGMEEKK